MTVPVVLATASPTRLAMLREAGVAAIGDPASIDEAEVKAAFRADGAPAGDVAEALAEMKARRVGPRHPGRLVVGADQMLDCEGMWLDKPVDREEARHQLLTLRGRTHELIASAVAVRDGARLWHHTDRARLAVRDFSDAFLDAYLEEAGDSVLTTVGGYRLEGRGAQLFGRVTGDFFTVLGLPLLPLLEFLRAQGAILR